MVAHIHSGMTRLMSPNASTRKWLRWDSKTGILMTI